MTPPEPKRPHSLRAALVLVLLAVLGYYGIDLGAEGAPTVASTSPSQSAERQALVQGPDGALDIAPTLERIERGESHSHRNDGSVFQNRERRLPLKSKGYYHEFVHPTPGVSGPGAQRVVIGDEDEVFYTPDHYETFQPVAWEWRREDP